MDGIVLSPGDAAIRAAEEQVGVLTDLYADEESVRDMGLHADFVAERRQELTQLRARLRKALDARELLPGVADPEAVGIASVLERLRGMIKDEPSEPAIAEETKLLQRCDDIIQNAPEMAQALAGDRAACAAAIDRLQNSD